MFTHVEAQGVLTATKELSNGQVAMVFATYSETLIGGMMYDVDFVIAEAIEDCAMWYVDLGEEGGNKLDYTSTGRCGLEGLMFALEAINELMNYYLFEAGDYIRVTPSDNKRESAYRRLLKYGFVKEGIDYVYTKQ